MLYISRLRRKFQIASHRIAGKIYPLKGKPSNMPPRMTNFNQKRVASLIFGELGISAIEYIDEI